MRAVNRVVGVDNLNDYYDVRLKQARLDRLRRRPGFEFLRLDVSDRDGGRRMWPRTQTSTGSCIWRPRQGCDIRSWTRMPTCRPTSWAIS